MTQPRFLGATTQYGSPYYTPSDYQIGTGCTALCNTPDWVNHDSNGAGIPNYNTYGSNPTVTALTSHRDIGRSIHGAGGLFAYKPLGWQITNVSGYSSSFWADYLSRVLLDYCVVGHNSLGVDLTGAVPDLVIFETEMSNYDEGGATAGITSLINGLRQAGYTGLIACESPGGVLPSWVHLVDVVMGDFYPMNGGTPPSDIAGWMNLMGECVGTLNDWHNQCGKLTGFSEFGLESVTLTATQMQLTTEAFFATFGPIPHWIGGFWWSGYDGGPAQGSSDRLSSNGNSSVVPSPATMKAWGGPYATLAPVMSTLRPPVRLLGADMNGGATAAPSDANMASYAQSNVAPLLSAGANLYVVCAQIDGPSDGSTSIGSVNGYDNGHCPWGPGYSRASNVYFYAQTDAAAAIQHGFKTVHLGGMYAGLKLLLEPFQPFRFNSKGANDPGFVDNFCAFLVEICCNADPAYRPDLLMITTEQDGVQNNPAATANWRAGIQALRQNGFTGMITTSSNGIFTYGGGMNVPAGWVDLIDAVGNDTGPDGSTSGAAAWLSYWQNTYNDHLAAHQATGKMTFFGEFYAPSDAEMVNCFQAYEQVFGNVPWHLGMAAWIHPADTISDSSLLSSISGFLATHPGSAQTAWPTPLVGSSVNPVNFNEFKATGTFYNSDGSLATGTIVFVPVKNNDSVNGIYVVQAGVAVPLVQGSLNETLIAVSNGYNVFYEFNNERTLLGKFTTTPGSTVDISQISAA